MKKVLFFAFFIPAFTLAQYPEDDLPLIEAKKPINFFIENQTIHWQKVFKGDTKNISHPKLLSNKGENCNTGNCNGSSIFMQEDFRFEFKVERKENRYRVTAYNLIFKNTLQIHIGNLVTDKKENSFEYFMLRNRDGKLRKNKTALRNLNCLDTYLTNMFTPKQPTKIGEW